MNYSESLQAAIKARSGRIQYQPRVSLEYMLFWAQVHAVDQDSTSDLKRHLTGHGTSLGTQILFSLWCKRLALAKEGFDKPDLPEGTDLEDLRQKALAGKVWRFWL